MFEGKANAALHLLMEQHKGSILPLNSIVPSNGSESQTVIDILENKHPAGQPVYPDAIIQPHANLPDTHPVLFDRIDASSIRSAALHTKGRRWSIWYRCSWLASYVHLLQICFIRSLPFSGSSGKMALH